MPESRRRRARASEDEHRAKPRLAGAWQAFLENKIISILDNLKVESQQYDILLIEDDLATIRLLKSYFESKGYSCKGVISGTKGIEELRTSTPKIILLDIILPDLSGYDLCKMIKSEKKFPSIY